MHTVPRPDESLGFLSRRPKDAAKYPGSSADSPPITRRELLVTPLSSVQNTTKCISLESSRPVPIIESKITRAETLKLFHDPRLTFESQQRIDFDGPIRRGPWSLYACQHGSIDKCAQLLSTDRWSLTDVEMASSEVRRLSAKSKGHRKAASWTTGYLADNHKQVDCHLLAKQPSSTKIGHHLIRSLDARLSNLKHNYISDRNHKGVEIVDESAQWRATQRRGILLEILHSEQGYIDDIKILAHLYLAILGSVTQFPRSMQSDVARNLGDIIALHEEVLEELNSCNLKIRCNSASSSTISLPGRINSLRCKRSKIISTAQDLNQTARIATIFRQRMSRFFVYEEYAARYEQMILQVAQASKNIPNWSAFERGIETLMHSLITTRLSSDRKKKGLTLEDLMIKPIQRICRYSLLFAELLRNTPPKDDAIVSIMLSETLDRLREMTREVNRATNEPLARSRIQRSWLLQDMLYFQDVPVAHPSLRGLGYARLCGVLHVTYQTTRGIEGGYLLCALFNSHLILAKRDAVIKLFRIIAITSTVDLAIQESNDGRGLQCSNALFSWKTTFVINQYLYEVILCACSAIESKQWRSALGRPIAGTLFQSVPDDIIFIDSNIKPVILVFGKAGSLSRQVAMQRAMSVDRKPSACHVIIKNTTSWKEGSDFGEKNTSGAFQRSQSLNGCLATQTLSPDRVERVRLELQLEHVWTKEILPFPGMVIGRAGNRIHASKDTVIRKLSSRTMSSAQSFKRSNSTYSVIDVLVDGASSLHGNTLNLADISSHHIQGLSRVDHNYNTVHHFEGQLDGGNELGGQGRISDLRAQISRSPLQSIETAEVRVHSIEKVKRSRKPKLVLIGDVVRSWF